MLLTKKKKECLLRFAISIQALLFRCLIFLSLFVAFLSPAGTETRPPALSPEEDPAHWQGRRRTSPRGGPSPGGGPSTLAGEEEAPGVAAQTLQ